MYKIFVSAMGYDSGRSGISTYINECVNELVKNHKVDLLILKKDRSAFPIDNENLSFIEVSNFYNKPVLNMLWHLFIVPFTKNLKQYDFCFLPAANRRLFCRNPVPAIAVFHDLSQFNIKAKYSFLRMFYIKRVTPLFLKKAHKIIAVSKNTRNDIIEHYGIDPEKIVVNHNGIDSSRFHPLEKNDVKNYSRLEIKKDYLLYVSRLEHPGKNHIKLIEAYENLPEEIKEQYNLVFAGQHWSGSEVILSRIEKSPEKSCILVTGFVPNKCLAELYQEASLFIFPSLYEGFGLPLVESMACGVPVICSNTSSLPEVGGNAVQTFSPNDSKQITKVIEKVLSNPQLYKDMKQKGLHRSKDFSWSKHVENIINEFKKIKR